MTITKRAKKVSVKYKKVIETAIYSEYKCPSCKVNFQGYGPRANVIRFRCECGQELIVEAEED